MPRLVVHPVPHLADGRKARITSGFGAVRKKRDGSDGTRLHMGADVLFRRECAAKLHESCPTDAMDTGRPYERGSEHEGFKWHFVPRNWPMLASEDGVVIRAGKAGRTRTDEFCAVLHDVHPIDGANATGYVHLEPHSLMVGVGDRVRAGDILGICGWGPTSGVHLHFDRWQGATTTARGRQIDPEPYLEIAQHVPCPKLWCGAPSWGELALVGGVALLSVAVLA